MKEKKGNRREWVKSAAIVFLTVMLILTFFSNTIMNYSLPEVAAQYIQSGTITAKIRGTGTVESGSLFNVKITESRKVMSVEVRTGDTVQIGDVICYLDDVESDELKMAREELEAANNAYDLALLAGDLSIEVMQNGGQTESIATYRAQIINAKNAVIAAQTEVDKAQKSVDDLQKQVDAFDVQISITPDNTADISAELKAYNDAKANKETADFTLAEAKNTLTAITSQLEHEMSISSGSAIVANLTAQKVVAEQGVLNAQTAANNAALAFAKAETALENKKATGDTSGTIANLQAQQAVYKVNLVAAQKTLTDKQAVLAEKQEALTDLTANINASLNLGTLYDAIVDAQEKVSALESKAVGATVTAEVAGTITSLAVVAGESTSPDMTIATIQPEGKGYTLSFSVTADQAKRISVGDPAELVNSWWYNDITATVASIKPDPSDMKKKLVTCNLTGDLTAGQSLSLQVGERSSTYDMIVPNSAIREDNNGKFILVVESKSSPLGNRYFAVRYDVEVLATDDTQSAISGGLYGYEYVITTSTKPVEAGDQVRLPD